MSKSIKILFLSIVLVFAIGGMVTAQETLSEVMEAVNLDENIQNEDLDVSEPRILPDSPIYFLKNWSRGIRSFFTFNPVAKAELKLKFSNEKLVEVKKMVELKKDPKIIKKGLENYQKEIDRIKDESDKIKEKAGENPKINTFLDKFIKHQILHQRILSKLETQVPEEVFEKIKEIRERHLERFGEIITKLEDKDKITERLEKNIEKIKGSKFKNFKNLEILINLEEKAPEEAKESIRKAQENVLKRLQGNLEKMSPEDQEKFTDYIQNINGEKERHLEILQNLKSEIMKVPITSRILNLKEKLEIGEIKTIEIIERKLEKMDCPQWVSPTQGFCKEGRVILERSPDGCPSPPRCIIPTEIEIQRKTNAYSTSDCIALWNPMCGKDGKTYSNKCFVRSAEVEINYEGECKETRCIQVITPAVSSDGVCKNFSTLCDVPETWKKVDRCPLSTEKIEIKIPPATEIEIE